MTSTRSLQEEARLDSINFSMITLIQKMTSPEHVGNYKLIALLNRQLKNILVVLTS